ncbi:MAG: pyruvate kinase, partial [Xanthomonadales bacterium]|nr:pyruvate kinase [Xanthomonadales bacterium]
VYPIAHVQQWKDLNEAITEAIHTLSNAGHLSPGDRVILTSGDSLGKEGGTNTLRLIQVGEGGSVEEQAELDLH